jgi:hypothetical protein
VSDFILDLIGPNLFIVAIAICPVETPPDQCTRNLAPDFLTHWVYRPDRAACLQYAEGVLDELEFDPGSQRARVYCVRAESFSEAYQELVP